MRAAITFALPTTRVNSASLAASEIERVDVYDNHHGDDHGKQDRADARQARADERTHREEDRDRGAANNEGGQDSRHQDQRSNRHQNDQQQSRDQSQDKSAGDLEKQDSPHGRRRKIGSWTNDNEPGTTPVFTVEDVQPGVHFYQLVAVDTDGRTSSPSAPFRLNVNEEEDTSTPEKNDEPALAHNVQATGQDDERPGLITKVTVRLI